mmetsp:Transcript_87701/g.247476  ORF Transcript_87701/g.247476 Transcript_87701/m.247476 type:complete len:155 (-) Transcript_87701:546-1010(-)
MFRRKLSIADQYLDNTRARPKFNSFALQGIHATIIKAQETMTVTNDTNRRKWWHQYKPTLTQAAHLNLAHHTFYGQTILKTICDLWLREDNFQRRNLQWYPIGRHYADSSRQSRSITDCSIGDSDLNFPSLVWWHCHVRTLPMHLQVDDPQAFK